MTRIRQTLSKLFTFPVFYVLLFAWIFGARLIPTTPREIAGLCISCAFAVWVVCYRPLRKSRVASDWLLAVMAFGVVAYSATVLAAAPKAVVHGRSEERRVKK